MRLLTILYSHDNFQGTKYNEQEREKKRKKKENQEWYRQKNLNLEGENTKLKSLCHLPPFTLAPCAHINICTFLPVSQQHSNQLHSFYTTSFSKS